jgi:hypothetical protein
MNPTVLLTLLAPPAMEETLVDWLLEIEAEYGFSSVPVRGHSSRHQGLSLAEQVSGRRQQIRFEIHLPATRADALVQQLRADFQGAGLHYWIVPLQEWGHV